jgi:hypothetical protein
MRRLVRRSPGSHVTRSAYPTAGWAVGCRVAARSCCPPPLLFGSSVALPTMPRSLQGRIGSGRRCRQVAIQAGVPHRGQGIVSGIGVPFPGRPRDPRSAAAPSLPSWLTCLPQGSVVPEWASSVAGRMDEVPCVTIWRWTASWPSQETARSAPVP